MRDNLRKLGLAGAVSLIVLVLLVFFQGGYLQGAGCATGAIMALVGGVCAVRACLSGRRLPWAAWAFCLLALVYLVSAIAAGPTLTTLTSAATWCGVAGFALVVGAKTPEWRAAMLGAVTWIGIAAAALGVLGWACSVGPLIDAGRLQFTFQYANAAGLWYAVTVLLCLRGSSRAVRAAMPCVLTALALTQSFGAFLSLLAVVIACVAWAMVRRRHVGEEAALDDACVFLAPRLLVFEIQAVVALAFAVPLWLTSGLVRVVVAALLLVACVADWRLSLGEKAAALPRKTARRACAAIVVVACVASLAVCVVASGRVSDAWVHLVERLIQMGDALTVWAGAPLLGVGPDNWQYVYQYIQTAQYHSATVHDSYLKILVDAGAAGLACYVVAVVCGIRHLARARDVLVLACVAVVLVHGFVDFDARFASIQFLLVLLVCDPSAPNDAAGMRRRVPTVALSAVCGLFCLVVCALGTLAALVGTQATLARETGNPALASSAFATNDLARNDLGFRDDYLAALCLAGENDAAAAVYDQFGALTDAQALYAARAKFALGQTHEAQEILVRQLELEPANYELFEAANSYFAVYGLANDLTARYDAAVKAANELIRTGWAAALPEQQSVEDFRQS